MPINWDNYSLFDFTEGMPYVSITINGLTFNRSVIIKLGYPQYAQLYFNPLEKTMIVVASEENASKAVPFYKEKKNGIVSARWSAKDLISTVSRITGWDLYSTSYRVPGLLLPEDNAMLFDFDEAQILK